MNTLNWYDGRCIAVVVEGPRFIQALAFEASGLVTLKIPKVDTRSFKPLLYKGQDYPLNKASRQFGVYAAKPGTGTPTRVLLARWRKENDL